MTTTSNTEQKLREAADKLLTGGEVELVLGFESVPSPVLARPAFFSQAQQLEKLTWNALCRSNLSVYLKGIQGRRVGLIARGCEWRALQQLAKEKQVDRAQVVVIGAPCPGIVDPKELEEAARGSLQEVQCAEGAVTFVVDGHRHTRQVAACLCPACQRCDQPRAAGADIIISPGQTMPKRARSFAQVQKVEQLDASQRWAYFTGELERCIGCYACRQACPLCYCESCFVTSTVPQWFPLENRARENLLFQLVRATHLTGRCIGCGACARACPMDIPVDLLTAKMEQEAQQLFGYRAGREMDTPSLLATFAESDPEEFL